MFKFTNAHKPYVLRIGRRAERALCVGLSTYACLCDINNIAELSPQRPHNISCLFGIMVDLAAFSKYRFLVKLLAITAFN